MFNDLETQNQIYLQEALCYFILLIEVFAKACLTEPSATLKQFDSRVPIRFNTHFFLIF